MENAAVYTNDDTIKHDEDRLLKLQAFAASLTSKRKDAVDFRKMSGVETLWQEDSDYYDGIDEFNQGDHWLKSANTTGPLTYGFRQNRQTASNRSTVFVNITAPYVDMAAARIADMLLPTDDKPFSIKPTPIPESDASGNSNDLMPGGQHTVGEASKQFVDEMTKKADTAEQQIWDWLLESHWHAEMRKVIEQAARIGTSCLKGPFPVKRTKRVLARSDDGTVSLEHSHELKPASKMVDIWNVFPDPGCGDDIHNGSYIFEREFISARQLRDLKGTGYIDDQIEEVLKEGPSKKNIDSRGKVLETDTYECWYFTGLAEYDELKAANCPCEQGRQGYPVVVTMINDRVIKASKSVLDSGDLPYDLMTYQKSTNKWYGFGVGRQIRTAQRMVIAASRNILDNAGVSAGPQIIIRSNLVTPADGEWAITPMKLWRVDEDADVRDVGSAITSIAIPSMQRELQEIIKMALEFAERATSMPLILQGQQGGNPTDTLGGLQLQEQNASTVLRRIAKTCDDDVIEPHIERFYQWLMTYSDNEEAKGDYTIDALGSSAFYQRDSSNMAIMQLIPMVANPVFGLNPEKIIVELLKANKITPERVMFSEDEKKQMSEAAGPQEDPKIAAMKEVAQTKAASDKELAQLKQTFDKADLFAKERMAQAELAGKLQMQTSDHDFGIKIKQMEVQVEIMRLSSAQNLSIQSIKAALADTTLRLKTEKELKGVAQQHEAAVKFSDQTHDVGMHDKKQEATQSDNSYQEGLADKATTESKPYEPAGKAPDNQAYNR